MAKKLCLFVFLCLVLYCLVIACGLYWIESKRTIEHHSVRWSLLISTNSESNHSKLLTDKLPPYHPSIIKVPRTSIQLYSAYIDNRTLYYGPSVYVLGIQLTRSWNQVKLYGSVTYHDSRSECIGPSIVDLPCGFKCNKYNHYTKYDTVSYSFKLPQLNQSNLPETISLSSDHRCWHSSKQIKIYTYRPVKIKPMGVCLQTPLYSNIAAETIVKFIEMHHILGVEQFTMYSQLSSNAKRDYVLHKYQLEGILELVPWSREFRRTYPVHYHGEVLIMHDCLYRNMNRVKYLSFVDLDEIIVPRNTTSLLAMIESIKKPTTIAFLFHNTYFTEKNHKTEEIDYFKQTYRLSCYYEIFRRSKAIVVPTAVSNIDVHGVYLPASVSQKYGMIHVPLSVGGMFHYRRKISPDCKNRTLIYDPIMLQYKDMFINNIQRFGIKININ